MKNNNDSWESNYVTIGDLIQQFTGYPFEGPINEYPEGCTGIDAHLVKDLKVSQEYQRDPSVKSIIKHYKRFDRNLCTPIQVASHPIYGKRIIDGQHRAIMHMLCGDDQPLPAIIYNENPDWNHDQCAKWESRIFWKTNTQKKKLQKVDELKAGLVWGEPLAKKIYSVMDTLKLNYQKFGYQTGTPRYDFVGFNQFYLTLKSIKDLGIVYSSYHEVWKPIWGDADVKFHGVMFKTCVLIYEFLNDESVGLHEEEKVSLLEYLEDHATPDNHKRCIDSRADANCHRYAFQNLIENWKPTWTDLDTIPDRYKVPVTIN